MRIEDAGCLRQNYVGDMYGRRRGMSGLGFLFSSPFSYFSFSLSFLPISLPNVITLHQSITISIQKISDQWSDH